MSTALLQRVRQSLELAGLDHSATLVVGFSGGTDSLSLLLLLSRLSQEGRGPRLHAVHVDHGLRPESGDDARWAMALASQLGVPCELQLEDAASWSARLGEGIEAGARAARYAALAEVAARLGTRWLAMAHTRDDQAETVLLRLLRGASLDGLTAMREVSRREVRLGPGQEPVELTIVRPLLQTRRAELARLLFESGLQPMEDPSNAAPDFRRNRVRLEFLRLAEEIAPGATGAIARTAELLADDRELLDTLAEEAAARVLSNEGPLLRVHGDGFRELAVPVQRRVLVRAVVQLSEGEPVLSRERVEALRAALLAGGRATVELGGGLVARVDAVGALLGSGAQMGDALRAASALPLFPGGLIALDGSCRLVLGNSWELEVTAPPGWLLRTRRRGDRLRRADGRLTRLQDWLVDRKVLAEVRDELPLLVQHDVVRWVAGVSGMTFEDADAGVSARLIRAGERTTHGE